MIRSLISKVELSLIMSYYAVKTGKQPGVYNTWAECEQQVKGFKKPIFKKFRSEDEAWQFVAAKPLPSQTFPLGAEYRPEKCLSTLATKCPIVPEKKRKATVTPPMTKKMKTERIVRPPSPLEISSDDTDEEDELMKACSRADDIIERLGTIVSESYLLSAELHALASCRVKKERKKKTKARTNSGSYQEKHHEEYQQSTRPNNGKASNEPMVVYTDGCCYSNGKAGAQAGIGIYWGKDHPMNSSERLMGRPTNNRAEIHAAIKAVRQAKEMNLTALIIKTDSQFLINAITNWIHKWKKNNWTLRNGGPVINREDFEELEAAAKGILITWVHVRGHSGIEGNEQADALANMGAKKPIPGADRF